MVSQLFGLAQKKGVRVILSGEGGDDTVSYGYEYLEQLAKSSRWAEFVKEANGISQHFGGTPMHYFRQYGVPYLTELARANRWPSFIKQACLISRYLRVNRKQLLLNAGLLPLVPKPIHQVWQRLARRRSPSSRRNQAIKPEFARGVGMEERIQGFNNNTRSSSPHHLREQHAEGLRSGNLQFLLGMFDQTAGIFSLEQRYPFYDKRLMEFCVAIPFEQKLKHGWTRSIFRRAMGNILPPSVQWRTDKGNLGRNIRYRLFEERKTLDSVIIDDPSLIEMYVDVLALQTAYARFLDKPADCNEDDLFTIYLTVSLALWLRQSEGLLGTS
jgi:asparagine synthase (glutamine-hydrolysing)